MQFIGKITCKTQPKENEGYFYLNSSLEIEYDLWVCGSLDEGRFKAGNCFSNKEQAKLSSKILKESLIKFNSLNVSGGDLWNI